MNAFTRLSHRPTWRILAALLAALGLVAAGLTVHLTGSRTTASNVLESIAATSPTTPVDNPSDDYPQPYRTMTDAAGNAAVGAVDDKTGFYVRNCTDFVAWRLRHAGFADFADSYQGHQFGNAADWAAAATALGLPVRDAPTAGTVAVFPGNWQGTGGDYVGATGHVGIVLAVDTAVQRVQLEDYNYFNTSPQTAGRWHIHWISYAGGVTFIDFSAKLAQPPLQGLTLRVADGALAGDYASASASGPLQARSATLDASDRYTFTPVIGEPDAYYIRSDATGGYLSARFDLTGDQRGALAADVTTPALWETFHEQHIGADEAFYVYDSSGTKWYVATEMNNGGMLRARTSPSEFDAHVTEGSWELFTTGS